MSGRPSRQKFLPRQFQRPPNRVFSFSSLSKHFTKLFLPTRSVCISLRALHCLRKCFVSTSSYMMSCRIAATSERRNRFFSGSASKPRVLLTAFWCIKAHSSKQGLAGRGKRKLRNQKRWRDDRVLHTLGRQILWKSLWIKNVKMCFNLMLYLKI